MSQARLIGRDSPTTLTGDPGSAPPRTRHLPEDLLREASHRLGVMSLLAGVLWFVNPAIDHIVLWAISPADPRWAQFQGTDGISLAAIALSLALFFYSRRSDRNPRVILDLGLVYMVLMAFALGVVMHWDPVPAHMPIFPMITWIGVMVLMF